MGDRLHVRRGVGCVTGTKQGGMEGMVDDGSCQASALFIPCSRQV